MSKRNAATRNDVSAGRWASPDPRFATTSIRLMPERPNHVWSWDIVFDRTDDGRPIKLMVVIDEYTRQCLAIHVARRICAKDAIDVFADLMATHGIPEHIRSDNGPEMIAKTMRHWLGPRYTERLHHAGEPMGERLL